MATMKLEIVAGGTTYTKTKTISAAHLTRFIAAERVVMGLPAEYTDAQVAGAWFDAVYQRARDETKAVESNAAAGAVAPIDIT